MVRRYYSYEEFVADVRRMARHIDRSYDAIVAIARGGVTFGHFLAEILHIRRIHTVNAIGYDDTRKLSCVEVFDIPDLACYERILLVDDIIDSGDTIQAVLEKLRSHYDVAVDVATLFYKPTASLQPRYYARIADAWIDFFWTKDLDDTHDR